MTDVFDQVHSYIRDRNYRAALSLIDAALRSEALSPRLHVLKATCLQLSEDEHTLAEVESALRDAISVDDAYVDAHLELGWYYLNVLDDAPKAKAEFERARDLLRKMNVEVTKGLSACAEELEPERDQRDLSTQIRQFLVTPEESSGTTGGNPE